MRYLPTLALALVFFLSVKTSDAIEPYPDSIVSSDVLINQIVESTVVIDAPYNFHALHNDQIVTLATWACGLYKRVAVGLSVYPSSTECDQMGQTMAERSWQCRHLHLYACAIP